VFSPVQHSSDIYRGSVRSDEKPTLTRSGVPVRGELVTDYLSRDFKHAGLFKAVAPYESKVEPTLILEGSVDEFFEWDSEDGWKAVLTVSTVLLSHPQPDLSKGSFSEDLSCGEALQEEKRC